MPDTPIDRLIFSLDADLTALKAKFLEAEAQAQKTGTNIKTNFGGGMKTAADDAVKSAQALKTALGGVDTAVKATHGSTATATREFRALFDELSSGRTRQTPGTLAIIATRVFGISGATLAWGAALAAIPAALAYAALQAESSFSRIQRVLESTGFAAGVTRDQIMSIGIAMDATTKLSEKGATDIATILAGRGNVGSGQLRGATQAAFGLAQATGMGYDKSATELEKILADPAKGASELQEQFKLLTASQMEEIKRLEDSGQKAAAQQVIIDSLNGRFKDLDAASFSLARTWDAMGKGLSDFWNHTGQYFSGTGGTTQQRVAALQNYNSTTLQTLAAMGIRDPRATLAAHPATGVNVGGGIRPLATIMSDYDARQREIDNLRRGQTIQDQKAKGGEFFADQQETIGKANALSAAYETQTTKQKKLEDQLGLVSKAVDMAIGPDVEYQDSLKKLQANLKLAVQGVKDFGDPLKEAQTRSAEQARINAARPENRARIQGEIEAQRTFRASIQNPALAGNAAAIRDLQTKNADSPDRFNREADTRKKNLEAMQEEAVAIKAVALAYDVSGAAAEAERIKGEAKLALTRRQIADEKKYADALRERAFWQAAAASAQQIENLENANAGLAAIGKANGVPAAIAAAKRFTEAKAASQAEFDNATTPEMRAEAQRHFDARLRDYATRDSQTGINAAQSSIYQAQNGLGVLGAQANAFGKGFTEDDMRHLQVAQQTFAELSKTVEVSDPAFADLYKQMLKVNTATSDLSDALKKAQQEAQDLADDITGPLEQFAQKGGNVLDLLNQIGDNLVNTVAKNEIFDPMNKALAGMFGSALGAPTADGSMGKPYYVVPLGATGAGGVPGVGGGGGIQDLISGIFGGGSSGGGLDSILKAGASGAFGADSSGAGLFSFANAGALNASLFGGAGAAGDFSFAGADAMGLFGGAAGAAGGAAAGGGFLSSLMSFLPLLFLADGGPMKPGDIAMVGEEGPELLQIGQGGYVTPLTAPSVRAALGTQKTDGDGGGGAFHSHLHLHGVTDFDSFTRSKSQIMGAVSKAAMKGRRNN